MPSNLPAIYVPPAVEAPDNLTLAADLLTVAKDAPQHRGPLLRAVRALLVDMAAPIVAPVTGGAPMARGKRGRRKAKTAKAAGRPRKPRAAKSLPPPAAEPPPAANAVGADAVTVVTAPDSEEVGFNGKVMEVTARQAQLVALLKRGMPNPIDRDFLARHLFPNQSKESAGTSLASLASSTKAALAGIGLDVHSVRGVGFVLRPLEAA